MNHMPELTNVSAVQCYRYGNEDWIRIANSHLMNEFFMMPLSSNDHWMFLSSNGAVTAGRQNEDNALFPYYSADKIVDTSASSGCKTVIHATLADGRSERWQPFQPDSHRDANVQRQLSKNSLGNKVSFEEVHKTLGLAFRYTWTFSNRFGFVRDCSLTNIGAEPVQIALLDGLQNVLPYGVDSKFQLRFSNLADAYKLNELLPDSGLGVFYLSSIPTDRAEPSEGLRATTVWQAGLNDAKVLVSERQVDRFLAGLPVETESVVRGQRGAYFASAEFELAAKPDETTDPAVLGVPASDAQRCWTIVADVSQDQNDVVSLSNAIQASESIRSEVAEDVELNGLRLLEIASACDGRQCGSDTMRLLRHQSNVMFNVMRGGMPPLGYRIPTKDYRQHLAKFNADTAQRNREFLDGLDDEVLVTDLVSRVEAGGDHELLRLTLEYLPFTFSRRHGDPTRPWNKFSIDFVNEDGSESLCYQGNWRDIFQNWEALSLSFPEFSAGMVFRFLNASTADGYNPYRVTQDGIEWETLDPDDPWANIGYWGDHQIIYLAKLLEWTRRYRPGQLDRWLGQKICSYVQIPYRIRSYEEICASPRETIDFDYELAERIDERVGRIGADGKLLQGSDGNPLHVSLAEKLLVPILVKITNFVPEGGLWLNTQRPEWNDANNALVGNGLSVVTACYMRRYLSILIEWFDQLDASESVELSSEVATLMGEVARVLDGSQDDFYGPLSDERRKTIVDGLSAAGCRYRKSLYESGFSGDTKPITLGEVVGFFRGARTMVDHTIRANRRDDGLYHSYNLMCLGRDECAVGPLYEMLEGQVAVLSSGLLSADEVVGVLDALRRSAMYREDQRSYMLYPDRELPTFLSKNVIGECWSDSTLLTELLSDGDARIVTRDQQGDVRFCGDFRNVQDLETALKELEGDPRYSDLVARDRRRVLDLYEETFHHACFTGRSGTFFAYEGLGSIYWHMVSKLALAAMETCWAESDGKDSALQGKLLDHYREVRDGLGLGKAPDSYGAFPTDAYSHTPKHAGVQQPGMTGQVKEDVISRFGELGVRVEAGLIGFRCDLFERHEILDSDTHLDYVDLAGRRVQLPIPAGAFAFTYCQTPIVYHFADRNRLVVKRSGENDSIRDELMLTQSESESVFARKGEISQIDVFFSSP